MLKPYKTVDGLSSAIHVVDKSSFICNMKCVRSLPEASGFVAEIRKKHYDATHNCYAYVTFDGQKYSDDGEPSGTAGIPILSVINKSGLMNLCIVVTRYFGGVKLGASGLARAYSTATSIAVESANIIEFGVFNSVTLTCPYNLFPIFKNLPEFDDGDVSYDENVTIRVNIKAERSDDFIKDVINLSNGAVVPLKGSPLLLPMKTR